MTLMLVFLAVLGAGLVVVMALGRFSRPGEMSRPVKSDDDGGHPPADDVSSDDDSVNDDGVLARRWKRGEVPVVRGLVEPVQNLPPVLLPDDPAADDVDRIRFSSGLRGYRMDQVDEVLDVLRDTLAAKEQRLAELEAEVAGLAADSGDTGRHWGIAESQDADTGRHWGIAESQDADGERHWGNAESEDADRHWRNGSAP